MVERAGAHGMEVLIALPLDPQGFGQEAACSAKLEERGVVIAPTGMVIRRPIGQISR